jgi:hypothetical protein
MQPETSVGLSVNLTCVAPGASTKEGSMLLQPVQRAAKVRRIELWARNFMDASLR